MNGLLLSGDIFIDRLSDTGVSQGKIGPINVTQLAINTPSEQMTRTSKKKRHLAKRLIRFQLLSRQPCQFQLMTSQQSY
ncbi:hypothetical protein [Catenovulum agarivorans]|uniref:hypothetical protein n=1 Tax=Catenovulum agarivorans TaxID=1172192 RepID=UPI0004B251B0|nr:hypothetical protein [Catenovulum agarivorans]